MATRIERCDVNISYRELLADEDHHSHPIELEDGIIHWKEIPAVRARANKEGINEIVSEMFKRGVTREDEEYRAFLRGLGMSLSAYWDSIDS